MKEYRNRDWLYQEYIVKNRIAKSIANEFNVLPRTIYEWLHRYNIKKGRYHNQVHLTDDAIDFLNGELLGDGSFYRLRSKSNGMFVTTRYQHSSKYKDYLIWLSSKLEEFGLLRTGIIRNSLYFDKRLNKKVLTYNYSTKNYSDNLLELANKWYDSDGKIVPRDIILNPITVRQWYIGDGRLNIPSKGIRRPYIRLHTQGFKSSDVEFLVDKLNEINIKCHRTNQNNIYIGVDYVPIFLEYIGQCPKEINHIYSYKWIKYGGNDK